MMDKRPVRKRLLLVAVCLTGVIAIGAWRYSERTRVIEGTWLWMFEGSEFFERRMPGRECELYDHSAGWLNYEITKVYPDYSYRRHYPSSGKYQSAGGQWDLQAFEVRFVGRKRISLFGAGHLRLWASEYEVDQILSIKPIGGLDCKVG